MEGEEVKEEEKPKVEVEQVEEGGNPSQNPKWRVISVTIWVTFNLGRSQISIVLTVSLGNNIEIHFLKQVNGMLARSWNSLIQIFVNPYNQS